jgi:hypothetical protein
LQDLTEKVHHGLIWGMPFLVPEVSLKKGSQVLLQVNFGFGRIKGVCLRRELGDEVNNPVMQLVKLPSLLAADVMIRSQG